MPESLTPAFELGVLDVAVARCLAALLVQAFEPLSYPSASVDLACARPLPIAMPRIGRPGATRSQSSAHARLPLQHASSGRSAAKSHALPSTAAAVLARAHLRQAGFDAPDWATVAAGHSPPSPNRPEEAAGPRSFKGWQLRAARACDERAYETHLTDLSPASRALLLSQAGPFAGRVFNVLPTHDDVTIPGAQFRVLLLLLLLRRWRMPLQLVPRRCSCHGQLGPHGDHRAACATSGVLSTRALPLEHAVARVCREAGARVARHVRLADMNLDLPIADERRIEVVANGLPLWHGSQLAVDATIVSPLTRLGEAHPRADVQPGCAVTNAARHKRHQTYPELGHARRCRRLRSAAGLGARPCSSCASLHAIAGRRPSPPG